VSPQDTFCILSLGSAPEKAGVDAQERRASGEMSRSVSAVRGRLLRGDRRRPSGLTRALRKRGLELVQPLGRPSTRSPIMLC
jgi:hypothetical protein